MNKNYTFHQDGSFHIADYNHTHTFSNFLPGIAGVWGIPLWVFYVNRGQAIASFGINDKDHPILEFFPANKSYWLTEEGGFRTFIKINKRKFYEPFRSNNNSIQEMLVKGASLEIKEVNKSIGLEISVRYFTLPNYPVAALARVLNIKNISRKKIDLEVIDGLSRIVPFGTHDFFLKKMSRTIEAWMHASIDNNLAMFRLIVDPADVSETTYIEGANFNYSFYEGKGKKISPQLIVDPDVLFAQDKSHSLPHEFLNKDFKFPSSQIKCGKTPCSLSFFKWSLGAKQERTFYSVFGSSSKKHLINTFAKKLNPGFIKQKEAENEQIISDIKRNALCVSGHNEFNHYVASSYLDNILRGGYPYSFNKDKTYYVFSRKHGDPERDYNVFNLRPTYFSEGEANYRDINQNRRMDLFFDPNIKDKNIVDFLSFIKMNGYNPLTFRGEKLKIKSVLAKKILKKYKIKDQKLLSLMVEGFYLGEFFKLLEEDGIRVGKRDNLAEELIKNSARIPVASFGEGYWIDHWGYTLDSIESFLYFFPDKLKNLFLKKDYMFWDDDVRVRDRSEKYYLKNDKVYQGISLEHIASKCQQVESRKSLPNCLHQINGRLYKTNLIDKLLSLILNKSATLDPFGIGVEMEAAKPGWCDSLNGLPALFGSSLCETLQLKRACAILIQALKSLKEQRVKDVSITLEIAEFLNKLDNLLKSYFKNRSSDRDHTFWQKANTIKEDFRKKVFFSVKGKTRKIELDDLQDFLSLLLKKLNIGIRKAKDKKSGLPATYFRHEVAKYTSKSGQVKPLKFKRHALPLFLEAPMHALRIDKDQGIYKSVRRSALFDKKLKMYKLNDSLAKEPLDIGRSRIFTPGWLENESIWLHMEYKYLLEVLRAGLYREFFNDFYNTCVCFFDPKQYGRSILENSSFIVSSAYPDRSLWGKGFVARLSGATAELLHIWIVMCLGLEPFSVDSKGKLCIKFSPILDSKMFTKKTTTLTHRGKVITLPKNSFAFKLFSSVLVVYHNPKRKDTFAGLKIKKITVQKGKSAQVIPSDTIIDPLSSLIRDAEVNRIDVYLG